VRAVLDDRWIDDLIPMDEDIPKSHHSMERAGEGLRQPTVAHQELEELAVRPRLPEALT
jgi:hypothetical protein